LDVAVYFLGLFIVPVPGAVVTFHVICFVGVIQEVRCKVLQVRLESRRLCAVDLYANPAQLL
jgi:hypothetical protein